MNSLVILVLTMGLFSSCQKENINDLAIASPDKMEIEADAITSKKVVCGQSIIVFQIGEDCCYQLMIDDPCNLGWSLFFDGNIIRSGVGSITVQDEYIHCHNEPFNQSQQVFDIQLVSSSGSSISTSVSTCANVIDEEPSCCNIMLLKTRQDPTPGIYKAVADISANEGDRIVFVIRGVEGPSLPVTHSCERIRYFSQTYSYDGCENLNITVKVIKNGQVCSSETIITAIC